MKPGTFFGKYRELLLGLAMLALAGIYLLAATYIKTRSTVKVDAKLIPEFLGMLVLVLGFFQTLAGIKHLVAVGREMRGSGAPEVFVSEEEMHAAFPVAWTFVLIILYALFLEGLGFILASTIYMVLQMRLLCPRTKRSIAVFAVVSLAVALVVYIAFRRGLDLTLPQGLLGNILG